MSSDVVSFEGKDLLVPHPYPTLEDHSFYSLMQQTFYSVFSLSGGIVVSITPAHSPLLYNGKTSQTALLLLRY